MESKSWTPFLLPLLLILASPARADFFQEQITRWFPGYVIMSPAEFDSDIRKNLKTNPAFVTGHFNQDEFEDFVALIRDTRAQRHVTRERAYDYHETRLVVCHGLGKHKYRCAELFAGVTLLPEYRYLVKRSPGRVRCRTARGEHLEAETDYIGWASTKSWATGGGETWFVFRPDGSWTRCGNSR